MAPANSLAGAAACPDTMLMSAILDSIGVTVNGETMRLPPGSTVAALIARLELDTRKVAVERNLEIVPRSLYADTVLAADDALEIVHFIGGG